MPFLFITPLTGLNTVCAVDLEVVDSNLTDG